jgi:Host cell surface-exposed lipoprotein
LSVSGGGATDLVDLAISDLCPGNAPAPEFTTAQQQAITSAQSYLDSGQGFSKAGLMDQLTSSFGEGFSHRLAKFALANVQVNWNRQAVISAKSYLRSGQGFSYAGLVQQLESPYGEQFTPAQAQHGAAVAFR